MQTKTYFVDMTFFIISGLLKVGKRVCNVSF